MATTFDSLPSQVDKILLELEAIKSVLTAQKTKEATTSKFLTFDKAIEFISDLGYPISKSKLYKLTANKEVPHSHFGRKLVFNAEDLKNWCTNK